jgi:hypothetical protein
VRRSAEPHSGYSFIRGTTDLEPRTANEIGNRQSKIEDQEIARGKFELPTNPERFQVLRNASIQINS